MLYRRRLPHFDVPGATQFLTFRLHGSLPVGRWFPSDIATGEAFAALDRLLDQGRTGPTYLRRSDIAQMVTESILLAESKLEQYTLHAFVVMPNHVHLLATPRVRLPKLMHSLKGYTALRANRMLGRSGSFWQEESYDHVVGEGEFDRILRYIEANPVRAGLARVPEEFPWSSAYWRVGRRAG